jgi:plastocyanin
LIHLTLAEAIVFPPCLRKSAGEFFRGGLRLERIMKNLKRLLFIAFLMVLESAGAGLGASPTTTASATQPATQPAVSATVAIDNFRFDPEVVTVPIGATVTWINHDDVPHTVTATVKKSFGSGALDTDDHFSHFFSKPGEFTYYCAVHPHMTGRVIVK